MSQLVAMHSPMACSVEQALLKIKRIDFQLFLNERFVEPFTWRLTSDRNIMKIIEAVDRAVMEKQREEVRIVTDHGKRQLTMIKDVLESACRGLQVGLDREEVLVISFSPNGISVGAA